MKNIERAKQFQRSLWKAVGKEWDFNDILIGRPFHWDWEELRELVELIFGDIGTEANEWIKRSTVTTNIIEGHWKKVCSLNNSLIEKNVLSGAKAMRLIEMVE